VNAFFWAKCTNQICVLSSFVSSTCSFPLAMEALHTSPISLIRAIIPQNFITISQTPNTIQALNSTSILQLNRKSTL